MSTELRPLAERAQAPTVLQVPDGGLLWRPMTADDAERFFTLVYTIEEFDDEPFRWSVEEAAEQLSAPWLDLTKDTLIGVDGGGTARAYGTAELRPGDTDIIRGVVSGGVHPQWRGRGIGTDLIAWLVGRARQLLAASGKNAPARIAAYAEDCAPAESHALLEAAGFAPMRYYSTLIRDLSGPLPPGAGSVGPAGQDLGGGLRLLPWSDELDEPTRLAHNDAFRDHWGSQPLTAEMWAHDKAMFAPTWSFVVVDDAAGPGSGGGSGPGAADVDDAAVVGYLMSRRYEQDWPVVGHSFGFVDGLGVRRGYRGRGVARTLLETAMRAYAADGMEFAHLGVDTQNPSGAYGLYASMGFVKRDGSRMYSIEI